MHQGERSNFVDSTTIHAVESLFRDGERDPWAAPLAGALADLFVYSDVIRYPLPVRHPSGGYDLAHEDSLLRDLARRDPGVFFGQQYSMSQPRLVATKHLQASLDRFSSWARWNRSSLRRWIALHRSPWIQPRRAGTTGEGYTFDLDRLLKSPRLTDLARIPGVAPSEFCYAFDSVLRYPLLGELAGRKGYYLNHPLRDAFSLPTMRKEEAQPPPIAVTFCDSVAEIAIGLSRGQYTILLHELRAAVRESKLHEVPPGTFDQELVRDLAARVRLSPRLRGYSQGVGVATGLLGGLGALPYLGVPAALIGGAISIGSAFWRGGLPRHAARLRWLHWAMKWDIEAQAQQRS